MTECVNLKRCPFVLHCEGTERETAAKGFIHMYCKGAKMEQCIRLRLCTKYGKEVVPMNMMPNGFPLKDTSKEGWSEEALNFRTSLS